MVIILIGIYLFKCFPIIHIFVAGPIIPTIQEAHSLKATDRFVPLMSLQKGTNYGTNTTQTIKGTFNIVSQYHFTMEAQTTLCLPAEEGIDVLSSSQYLDFT